MPELELREATDEGPELVGASGRKGGPIGHLLDLGVYLGRKERNQQLEDVDSQPVRDDVVPLNNVHTHGVDECNHQQEDPTVHH